jgi:hypothetical protein
MFTKEYRKNRGIEKTTQPKQLNKMSDPQAAHLHLEAFGAEEGTRTPTPLRVRGPEPRASANSATSAH